MLTLKFVSTSWPHSNVERIEVVQVEGYVIERILSEGAEGYGTITVRGLNEHGEYMAAQNWPMAFRQQYGDGIEDFVVKRGQVFVMNEAGKTIDRFGIDDWPLYHEARTRAIEGKLGAEECR